MERTRTHNLAVGSVCKFRAETLPTQPPRHPVDDGTWSICVASISVTITHIWTKFGTEHKYRTINTPEWPNSHKLKIQDGGGRHLEFWKNVNKFGLDKDILHQIIWEDAPRRRGDDHVRKSLNRKLIRVTSSNKCLQHMCVDLSDYNTYLNQILYRTKIPHYQHAGITKFT